jgi:DNA repair photolyase
LASTHVTTEVGRLEEFGLLKKTPGKNDKRQVLVALTSKGVATIERVSPIIQQVNDTLFRGVDAKSFRVVGRVVRKIAENSRDALKLMELDLEVGFGKAKKAKSSDSPVTSRATRIPSPPDSRITGPRASAHSARGRKSAARSRSSQRNAPGLK